MKPTIPTPQSIKIKQLFTSINGEVNMNGQGSFTHFVRFAGCNLKCNWCDTKYAQDYNGGIDLPTKQIIDFCSKPPDNVTITGGEPLMQKEALLCLVKELSDNGNSVSIETNGSIKVPDLDRSELDVGWVIDVKLPSSGHYNPEWEKNLPNLDPDYDWLKFVIGTDEDYSIAKEWVESLDFLVTNIAFAPVSGKIKPHELSRKMIKDNLCGLYLNVQIHKFIGVR